MTCLRKKFADRETAVFLLFFAVMAIYYGWRMFALTPWYDELYTYYYFISRGPVYAAIHWPLPNNHIGYSVLSACLGVFGNSAIALRGVSFLCSLGSLVLLFQIAKEWFGSRLALTPVFLYAGMHLVNQLAVQGRGYALVSFCCLSAVFCLQQITSGDRQRDKVRYYIVCGCSMVMALYAIPSSVYVVMPLCLAGGVTLLAQRQYGRIVRLVLTALISAACTVGLYGLVWLAIGSNLLVKTQGSMYYGMGHRTVILRAPLKALRTGIDYMLATPYIQSVGREGFLGKFGRWLMNLLNEYYRGGAAILAALIITSVILSAAYAVRKCIRIRNWKHSSGQENDNVCNTVCEGKKCNTCYEMDFLGKSEERGFHDNKIGENTDNIGSENVRERQACGIFREIYLSCSIACILLMLLLQCSLPYYRVFSFAGITVALSLTWLLHMAAQGLQRAGHLQIGKILPVAGSVLSGILCIYLLWSPAYLAQYGGREAAIEDACRHVDLANAETVGVTDCDQEYLLLFLYGIGEERIAESLEEAQVVLADKFLLLGYDTEVTDWSGDDWKLYLSPEQFEASGVARNMEAVYENDRFVVYMRKEG